MAIKLADVKDPERTAAPLKIIESGTGKASALAVAERADGTFILARKSERVVKVDGQPTDPPTRETIYKPTAALADIARALGAGLIA